MIHEPTVEEESRIWKEEIMDQTPEKLSRERLLDLLQNKRKVYAVVRRVSSSGLTRWVDFFTIEHNELWYLTGHIANVLSNYTRTKEGLKVEGTGMDMVFAVVYDLSTALYGNGYILRSESI